MTAPVEFVRRIKFRKCVTIKCWLRLMKAVQFASRDVHNERVYTAEQLSLFHLVTFNRIVLSSTWLFSAQLRSLFVSCSLHVF